MSRQLKKHERRPWSFPETISALYGKYTQKGDSKIKLKAQVPVHGNITEIKYPEDSFSFPNKSKLECKNRITSFPMFIDLISIHI